MKPTRKRISSFLSNAEFQSLCEAITWLDDEKDLTTGSRQTIDGLPIALLQAAVESLRGHPRGHGVRFLAFACQRRPFGTQHYLRVMLRVTKGYPEREPIDIAL